MSESSLTAAYEDLRADVGHFLGYTRDPAVWNARQLANVAAVLKAGLRQFYFCSFQWSFLKPVRSVTLHAGTNTAQLPDDYAAMEGPVVVGLVAGQNNFYRQLGLGPAQEVYLRQTRMPGTTGAPEVLCEEVTAGGPTAQKSQRMQLRVWPTADGDYTLTFPMMLLPGALTGELPMAYGGAQHAQTLLQSCKAAAERDIDTVGAGDPRAVHQPEFARLLEVSKTMDRRNKAQTVGPMWDRSDLRRRRVPGASPRPLLPIVVQGQIYD